MQIIDGESACFQLEVVLRNLSVSVNWSKDNGNTKTQGLEVFGLKKFAVLYVLKHKSDAAGDG